MANRVLRDWTDSENINKLSVEAERFFTRLIMKVDDYGCYSGHVKLLKSTLFPLISDNISDGEITNWLTECSATGIILLYKVDEKPYLQIADFNQRLRIKKGKYPTYESVEKLKNGHTADLNAPDVNQTSDKCQTYDGHVTASGLPETKRNEVETETKPKLETEIEITPLAINFWFKFQKQKILEPVSTFFKQNFQSFREQFEMKYGDEFTQEIYERLDADYNGYEFNSPNHLQNTFKHLYQKIEKEKSSAKKEKENNGKFTTNNHPFAKSTEVKRAEVFTMASESYQRLEKLSNQNNQSGNSV